MAVAGWRCLGGILAGLTLGNAFSRLFLRTLRALCDLRRYAPSVTIQNLGGQVNVAAQQVVANAAGARQAT